MRWSPFLLFMLMLVWLNTAQAQQLLILGDSLSAGYRMPIEQAWPSLLPNALKKHQRTIDVINASVSGDTSGNGLARLKTLLQQHHPEYVLIELGANDGLRGFSPNILRENLSAIIALVQQHDAIPILMQIHIPPNYGRRYSEAIARLYPELAKQHQTALIPFFLVDLIKHHPQWMMADQLHPKPEAQPWIASWVAAQLAPIIK